MDGVTVMRSRRKTIALSLQADGSLVVRAPLGMSDAAIGRFVESKQVWIAKKRALLEQARESHGDAVLSDEEVMQLKAAAKIDLTQRVVHWAPKVGVEIAHVGIRTQRTRWGSCSAKGNLSLNALLMLAPESVRDYVVVHELCHLREMNHSPRFWALVAKVLPNYKSAEAWLKKNGHALLWRIGK